MQNKQPFFSIVIPTRNRDETLYYTIKTVLQQSFKDYELIICDNNSSKETKEVVNSFNSQHIKYIRSDKDLAMTDNWELAVSHAIGKYITVIADNDGFIDGSLGYLHKKLLQYSMPDIIRWEKNSFYCTDLDVYYSQRLGLKTNTNERVLYGVDIANDVLNAKVSFHKLPMIYCSVINSSLIKKLKLQTGKVFHARSPDIFSGFAFLHLAKEYISLDTPITINGTSKKSNGFNGAKNNNNEITRAFLELNQQAGYTRHRYLPDITNSIFHSILDSFLHAQEILDIKEISLERKYIIDSLIDESTILNEKELNNIKDKFLESCLDDENLFEYTKKVLDRLSISEPPEPKDRLGFYENVLYLDGKEFNINNIYEASKFMTQFYNYAEVN